VAYVGNTGVSTGPHLHFGLYKNNQPINPASIIKVAKSALAGNEKKAFNEYAKSMRENIELIKENPSPPQREEQFVYSVNINEQ
jgi:hypothetical protein